MNRFLSILAHTVFWLDEHKGYGVLIMALVLLSIICSAYCVNHEYHHENQYRVEKQLWLDTKDSLMCNMDYIKTRLDRIEASNEVQLKWLQSIYYKN